MTLYGRGRNSWLVGDYSHGSWVAEKGIHDSVEACRSLKYWEGIRDLAPGFVSDVVDVFAAESRSVVVVDRVGQDRMNLEKGLEDPVAVEGNLARGDPWAAGRDKIHSARWTSAEGIHFAVHAWAERVAPLPMTTFVIRRMSPKSSIAPCLASSTVFGWSLSVTFPVEGLRRRCWRRRRPFDMTLDVHTGSDGQTDSAVHRNLP